MQPNVSTFQSEVDQLNSFLRGELSAAESYRLALDKFPSSPHRNVFQDCAASHELRARLLADEVRRLGGTPASSSGAWGAFTKLVEGGAAVVGENATIAVLEEGEDHGRNDYQRDLDKLTPTTRRLIESRVYPEQLRTHDALSRLKNGNSLRYS